MFRAVPAALTLVLVMASCGEDTGAEESAEPNESPSPEAPTEEPADVEGPESAAVADLAAQTGVDPAEIDVVLHEEVTWRDGSLGCPEPGKAYTQALVDGYRITLSAEGEEYAYHGAKDEPPFRCDDPDPNGAVDNGTTENAPDESGDAASPPTPAEPEEGDDPTDPPADPPKEEGVTEHDGPVAEAIADLASQTGVDPAEIEVVTYEQVTWRNGALGCPEPGMMYTQALVDGYRIVLRAAGQEVSYHGATGTSPFRCDKPDPNGPVDDRARS